MAGLVTVDMIDGCRGLDEDLAVARAMDEKGRGRRISVRAAMPRTVHGIDAADRPEACLRHMRRPRSTIVLVAWVDVMAAYLW